MKAASVRERVTSTRGSRDSTVPVRPLGDIGAALRRAGMFLGRCARASVTITAPPQNVRLERDVVVPMRDGVRLRVNVFRPDDDLPRPVLLCAQPYGKDRLPRRRWLRGGYEVPGQYRLMPQSEPITHSAWTSWEGPDPAYWVPRGYVVISADLRGWGRSDGVGELFSAQEAQDCHDLVEWAAVQPWSTGRVGMTGVSYLAISQWEAASTRPTHLAAICPWEGLTDTYRDFTRPGGVRNDGFLSLWSRMLRGAHGSPATLDQEARTRPLFDEFWAALNRPIEDIQVPALVCGSFSDHGLHTGGSFEGFRRIGSADKWLYTHRGPKWATYYSPAALALQSRFFDQFLLGQDTGILEVPRIRVEVREDAQTVSAVRGADTWPPMDTIWQNLELDAATGWLRTIAVGEAPSEASCTFDTRRSRASFVYRFDRDVEVVGPMLLRVALSVQGADDVSLFAGVRKLRGGRDVTFEGSFGYTADLVTHGMLLASHRHTDPSRSLPYLPFHPHTSAEPLTAGQVVSLSMSLLPSGTLFRAGDQLRLDLQGRWFFPRLPVVGQFPAHYVASPRASCTIHTGGVHQASLTLPIANQPPHTNAPTGEAVLQQYGAEPCPNR